uniref:non-specific serine/threonine protein kinase n=1 Tax=Aegilops tauschii subsp. strangulata TaxID=200361 RepID=A0A453KDA3_AEGTS
VSLRIGFSFNYFDELLGKGAMKSVYRGFDEVRGVEVAWNQANLADVLRTPDALQRMYSEVHLLSTLRHDAIIAFHASWVPHLQLHHRALLLRHPPRVPPPVPAREPPRRPRLGAPDPPGPRLPPRPRPPRHPPRPQVRQRVRQRPPGHRQDRRPRPRRRAPRRPGRAQRHRHARVHGARDVRRGLRRARRRLLLRHVHARDAHRRVPLRRVLQPRADLQEGHLRQAA